MTNERRELILRLAAASYLLTLTDAAEWVSLDAWKDRAVEAADILLAALDKESPPTQGASTPAPGGEPLEWTCRWTLTNTTIRWYRTSCGLQYAPPVLTEGPYCRCGGRIVEAT